MKDPTFSLMRPGYPLSPLVYNFDSDFSQCIKAIQEVK